MKKKNIFFIILVFVLISSIVSLNYFVDPYKIFAKKDHVLNTFDYPMQTLYLRMKAYKEQSPETLVIGFSETTTMFSHHCFRLGKFNLVALNIMPYEIANNIFSNYLDINDQTKTVVIFLSYMPFFEMPSIKKGPVYTGENFSISELSKFLLSYDITIKSIKTLKKNYDEKKRKNNNIEDPEICYSKQMHSFHDDKNIKVLNEINDNNLQNILNMINLIKEKNIKCSIVIPPYNAIFLAMIDQYAFEKQIVENLKRFLVENIPSDIPIYDMAFVNKHTSVDLLDVKDDMYYFNYNHPNAFLGSEVYKVLFDKDNADDSLYMLLSKDNIEASLDEQDRLLKNYKLKNKSLIDFYSGISYKMSIGKAEKIVSYKRKLFSKDFSRNLIEDSQYIDSLCEECDGE